MHHITGTPNCLRVSLCHVREKGRQRNGKTGTQFKKEQVRAPRLKRHKDNEQGKNEAKDNKEEQWSLSAQRHFNSVLFVHFKLSFFSRLLFFTMSSPDLISKTKISSRMTPKQSFATGLRLEGIFLSIFVFPFFPFFVFIPNEMKGSHQRIERERQRGRDAP